MQPEPPSTATTFSLSLILYVVRVAEVAEGVSVACDALHKDVVVGALRVVGSRRVLFTVDGVGEVVECA